LERLTAGQKRAEVGPAQLSRQRYDNLSSGKASASCTSPSASCRTGTEDFAIPHGKTLVITDVEWNWSNQNQPFVNQSQLFRLFLGPNTANDVAKSVAMTDSNSFAGTTEALTSGFTVAQGTPVCGFFAFGPSQFVSSATLGGYLDDSDSKKHNHD
jgi:hypothetical protein